MLVAFVMIQLSSIAQEISNNFVLENRSFKWTHIYETTLSYHELVESIQSSGYFKEIIVNENYIICDFKPYMIDYKMHGYKTMLTPFYISQNVLLGSIKIDYKENKYRVTINNIQFIQDFNTPMAKQGEMTSFEFWVLNNKGKIKYGFYNDGSDIMNKDFIAKTQFVKDDW